MCLGRRDNSAQREAERARQETERREAERQAAILSGQQRIDDAFGGFNDDYFGQFTTSYKDNQFSQLDDQYANARDRMIAAMAGRGMLNSSTGQNAITDLTKRYNDERVNIAQRASDAANDLRSNIENSKTDLYGVNQSIADPETIATRATAASTAVRAPSTTSPLGDIFATALGPVVAYQNARVNSPGRTYRSPTARSSGRIVG